MTRASIESVVQEISTSDAVVVMGAGVSFSAGMPLAGQLAPLVWHALETNGSALEKICEELGVARASAKSVVADDPERIRRAFKLINSDRACYETFTQSFCDLDRSRRDTPSLPHTALARLVHGGRIVTVISLNWDSLLESAFHSRFGFGINGQKTILWKPHGDCTAPQSEWTLPHEAGTVPPSLLQCLSDLASVRPRVLLVIGYSENDEAIVQQLIEPFASRWRVFRVGPAAKGEGAINTTASEALEFLADRLLTNPDAPGWSIVTFANQRGLEAAISGERLGPRDVDACPRLPFFDTALAKLSILDGVEIAGDSGCGKSITVWQLADHLHRQEWQVLRLERSPAGDFAESLSVLKRQRWKTVAVVDDAQLFPPSVIDGLRDLAGKDIKVILGTTDPQGHRQEAIRAAAKVSVETLATHFRSRRAVVSSIVREYDPRVGDGFAEVRIERRIAEAVQQPTPWQFAYVLRGGTAEIRSALSAARDFDGADLLLVVIAARQLSTRDGGSSLKELTETCSGFGRTESWVRASLETLRNQKMVLYGDIIRCLHLRLARLIVEVSLTLRKGSDYVELGSVLQTIIKDSSLTLIGLSWLLHCLWDRNGTIVSTAIKAELVSRCLTAGTHLEIREACFVMEWLLGRRDEMTASIMNRHSTLIRSWLSRVDATDAYAAGSLINNLYNYCKAEANALLGAMDPRRFAEKVGAADPNNGYVWGHFIDRAGTGGGHTWRSAVTPNFPRESMRHSVAGVSPASCEQLPSFIDAFASFDLNLALELYEVAAPILASSIGERPIETMHTLFNAAHWIFGEGLFFDETPSRRQRAITRTIFEGVCPDVIARGILTCPFGEWETYARLVGWIRRAHRKKHLEIVNAIDWDDFEVAVRDKIAIPGRELIVLLRTLVIDSMSCEPVRSWLVKSALNLKRIPGVIAALSPQATVLMLRNGGAVDFALDPFRWRLDAIAIAGIAMLDEKAAAEVVRANIRHIAKGATELSLCDGMAELLMMTAEFPEALEAVFSTIDSDEAAKRWKTALRDHRTEERRAARKALRFVGEKAAGELGRMASRLVKTVRYRKRTRSSTVADSGRTPG